MSAETRTLRARLAGLTRVGAEPERIEAVRGELRFQHFTEAVRSWEPLTHEQRAELTRLIWAGAGDAVTS